MRMTVRQLDWLGKKVKHCLERDYGAEIKIQERTNKYPSEEHIDTVKTLIEKTGLICVKRETSYGAVTYTVINIDPQAPDPDGLREKDRQAMIEALRTILSLLKHRISHGKTAILGYDELRPDGRFFPIRIRRQLMDGLRNHGIPVRHTDLGDLEFDADYETIRKIEGYMATASENVTPRQYLIAPKTTK